MSEILAERIRFFRKQLGLTQEELAEKCNVSASCISRWETGQWHPNTQNALSLAQSLHINLSDLCKSTSEPTLDNALIEQISGELGGLTHEEKNLSSKWLLS